MKFYYQLSAALIGATIVVVQPQIAVPLDEQDLGIMAKEVTVVINGQNPGSGVIISKQGNTYYVLTAKHVVAIQDQYEIFTSDGTKHVLNYQTVKKLAGVDLAIVQFTSDQNYRVAELGDSEATKEGATIYISGWPYPGPVLTERIYQITSGTMSGRPLQTLQDGYALVYTNVTRSGMSGSPILDDEGRVIGIHGRADGEPIFNPETGNTINVKSGFNLGIPIKTFFDLTSAADIPPTPTFAFSLTDMGDRSFQQNRLPEAVAYYQRAIAQNAKYFPAVFDLGLVKYQQGDVETAIRQWQTAVEIDKNQTTPQLAIAAAIFAKGDRDRGLAMASAVLQSDSKDNPYDGYKTFGDMESVLSDVEKNLRGDRLLTDAKRVLSYFSPSKTLTIPGENPGDNNPIVISPDRKTVAIGNKRNNNIKLWDLGTEKELRILSGISRTINYIAFSPDGKTIAGASNDHTIKLWDFDTGKELRTLSGHAYPVNCLAFSPDGKTLVSGSNDETIKLWDLGTGKELRTLTGHSGSIYTVAISPDGQTVASASSDGIKLWNLSTGSQLGTLTGHSDSVSSVAFSPDGKMLVTSSLYEIKVWDAIARKELHTLKAGKFFAISPDSKTIATSVAGSDSRNIKLWDLQRGQEILTLAGEVSAIAFSPDAKNLFSVSITGDVKIWPVAER